MKNPPWGRLESRQIRHPGQNMTKIVFFITFLINHIIGLKHRFSELDFPNLDRLHAENAQC